MTAAFLTIFPLPATPANIAAAKAFVLTKWIERHLERFGDNEAFRDDVPTDLSSSCKFSALFAQRVFGGEIRANPLHTFVRLDGKVLDLNIDAADVTRMSNPHSHWRSVARSRDFRESLASCRPRVDTWVKQFATAFQAG